MTDNFRRDFINQMLRLGGAGAASAAALQAAQSAPQRGLGSLPAGGLGQLYLPRPGRNRRSSSWDRRGKNNDYVGVEPGATAVLADIQGAGCVRHIWVTIAVEDKDYLRKLVFRAYWDGESSPSIESPAGDFFGVGHGRVSNYWSMPLNMVTGGQPEKQNRAAMNCYFPMPFAKGARFTIENQGATRVRALYFQVDHEEYPELPDPVLRFHAHWRRQNPTAGTMDLSNRANGFLKTNDVVNLDGQQNYTLLETTGRGHYVGCNLSIDHINPIPSFGWFGEGDDMIYIDGETTPSIIGTGTEDYFCAAWGYPGGFNSMPYHGISLAGAQDGLIQFTGKWTMYRYHIEDPISFTKSIKVTIEHGHGNVQSNDYSSVAYWYQTEPHQAFPPLLSVDKRMPISEAESSRLYWKTY
jgi:hypothetical protein